MPEKTTLAAFCKALKKYDHFLLSCHVSPEGDAIGSILAVDSLLRRLGKKTTVVCEDAFPERLSCLSDKRWQRVRDIKKPASHFKALVVTDCPTLERIGTVNKLLTPQTKIFNIDHHISNELFGHYNYLRPEAAACGEVVVDIFKYFHLPLRRDEATNLYVALSTDTGSFKYSNTTVHCHRIAAELIATGIDIEKINDELYATYSLNKINLYSRLLARVKTRSKGRVAWVGMKRNDLAESGATYEDTEGFIDFLKYLKEVQVAFFMSEMREPKKVRVSFRSKGHYDVNKIATFFKGGGHKKASGCVIQGSLQHAEAMILSRLKKVYRFS
ncbi:MAG TPA: bifunctional oligoribonuclease/PAP phosphatase NrnA [bacterium]|nr:bifunctional oligoribonuclease/PAP phosphatase NrnA [bacterium]